MSNKDQRDWSSCLLNQLAAADEATPTQPSASPVFNTSVHYNAAKNKDQHDWSSQLLSQLEATGPDQATPDQPSSSEVPAFNTSQPLQSRVTASSWMQNYCAPANLPPSTGTAAAAAAAATAAAAAATAAAVDANASTVPKKSTFQFQFAVPLAPPPPRLRQQRQQSTGAQHGDTTAAAASAEASARRKLVEAPGVSQPQQPAKRQRHEEAAASDERLSAKAAAYVDRLRRLDGRIHNLRRLVVSTFTEKKRELLQKKQLIEETRAQISAKQKRMELLKLRIAEETKMQDGLRNRMKPLTIRLIALVMSTKNLLHVSATIKLLKSNLQHVMVVQNRATQICLADLLRGARVAKLCLEDVQSRNDRKKKVADLVAALQRKLSDADEELRRARGELELAREKSNILEQGQKYIQEILQMRQQLTDQLLRQRLLLDQLQQLPEESEQPPPPPEADAADTEAEVAGAASRVEAKARECEELEREIEDMESQLESAAAAQAPEAPEAPEASEAPEAPEAPAADSDLPEASVVAAGEDDGENAELDRELLEAEAALEADKREEAEEQASMAALSAERASLLARLEAAERELDEEQMLTEEAAAEPSEQQLATGQGCDGEQSLAGPSSCCSPVRESPASASSDAPQVDSPADGPPDAYEYEVLDAAHLTESLASKRAELTDIVTDMRAHRDQVIAELRTSQLQQLQQLPLPKPPFR